MKFSKEEKAYIAGFLDGDGSIYVKLKQRQAKLMIEILGKKGKIKTPKEFLNLAERIDLFQQINYSKKRVQNSLKVKKVLKDEGLLAP